MNTVDSAKNFVVSNQKTILIAVGVAVVLFFAYRYMSAGNEGFNEHDQHDPHRHLRYPGVESFYHGGPGMMDQDPQGPMGSESRMHAPEHSAPEAKKKIMLFFAVWCPHCKELTKPDGVWNQLMQKHGHRKDLQIESVDCEAKPEMATKYGVGGFPTIKMFHGDKTIDYDGDRSLASLEQFIDSPQ